MEGNISEEVQFRPTWIRGENEGNRGKPHRTECNGEERISREVR